MIIRAVRAKGIDCAAWPQAGAGTIYASGIDGSGAQGFLIVSPLQKVRISSVLLKNGIRDALVGAAGVQTRGPIDARAGREGNIDEAGIAQIF